MLERKIKVNGIYKHFKGNIYQVLGTAIHSETEEVYVIYKQLSDTNSTWIRPIDMFLSEVEHNKYPEIKQKYRFELIED